MGTEEPTYTAPATQAELDRIVSERVSRERAKYADYNDLKAKADKFDELDAANKTALEKATERGDKAEARVKELEDEKARNALAAEVGKVKGVPAEFLSGTTKEELEAHADRLNSHYKPEDGDSKKPAIGPYVPSQGNATTGAATTSPADSFAEALSGN